MEKNLAFLYFIIFAISYGLIFYLLLKSNFEKLFKNKSRIFCNFLFACDDFFLWSGKNCRIRLYINFKIINV